MSVIYGFSNSFGSFWSYFGGSTAFFLSAGVRLVYGSIESCGAIRLLRESLNLRDGPRQADKGYLTENGTN